MLLIFFIRTKYNKYDILYCIYCLKKKTVLWKCYWVIDSESTVKMFKLGKSNFQYDGSWHISVIKNLITVEFSNQKKKF